MTVDLTLYSEDEAAKMLRISPKTMAYWRWKRIGPHFVKVGGKVFYRPHDLTAYLDRRTVETRSQQPPP